MAYLSHEYRENLRYAVRVLPSPEHEAMLLPGERANNMTMDDLEAFYEVMVGKPLQPPPGYKSRR